MNAVVRDVEAYGNLDDQPRPRKPRKPSKSTREALERACAAGYEAGRRDAAEAGGSGAVIGMAVCALAGFLSGAGIAVLWLV